MPDNASELLRRYLEQRRESGETELVLDGMTVEDVMKIVGARPTAPGRPAPVQPAPVVAPPVERLAEATPVERADAPSAPSEISGSVPIAVGKAGSDLFGGPFAKLESLEAVAAHAASCKRCPLWSTATNCVPGDGSPKAELVCVGEAPGEQEDLSGHPFVGRAGQLLTKILAAINLQREDVFICNVLKHRPPGNRNPLPDEVTACSPYLVRQIELIRPKVILAFGTFAAQTLLETKLSIGKLRGTVHRYYGVPLIVTYHPAALLRNPAWKRPTWDDVQHARRLLDGPGLGA
ncbi:MAG TPA: uracil-DNA glycosylase family protein [Gemmatimonadaceae bacterium]|nr:uracil-DNA glycosylase family protein [Gemmatimonadaceae bacterium]